MIDLIDHLATRRDIVVLHTDMCLKYSADLKIVALLFMCVTFVQREYVKGGRLFILTVVYLIFW